MPSNDDRTPAKSAESIRSRLESMRRAYASDVPAGPRLSGVRPTDRIVIASFHSQEARKQYQRDLSALGIPSTHAKQGRRSVVSVDAEDCDRALEELRSHREKYPDKRQTGMRRDFDFLILGSVIGVNFGAAMLFVATNRAVAAMSAVAVGISCALIGHFLDRIISMRQRSDRVRIGLRECLLFIVVVAFALSLPYFASMVLSG